MRYLSIAAALVALSLALTACGGWQLRGAQSGEPAIPALQLAGDASFSPMARAVKDVIRQQSIVLTPNAQYHLQLLDEELEKRPVTFDTSGTPTQYEMTLRVTYALQNTASTEVALPRTVEAHRVFDFDPRNIVAKSEEERALLDQMRQQLAQSLINQAGRQYEATGFDTP